MLLFQMYSINPDNSPLRDVNIQNPIWAKTSVRISHYHLCSRCAKFCKINSSVGLVFSGNNPSVCCILCTPVELAWSTGKYGHISYGRKAMSKGLLTNFNERSFSITRDKQRESASQYVAYVNSNFYLPLLPPDWIFTVIKARANVTNVSTH